MWDRTTDALEAFNELAGKRLGAITGSREPTDAARRIYLRLSAWPDVGRERVREIIALTLESKWWGSDEPSIGVVFGPKIWEENMARRAGTQQSAAAKKAAADAERRERRARRSAAIDRIISGTSQEGDVPE